MIEQLIEIVRRLRDPLRGCPWDRVQTSASVAPYALEEAYEVVDAIERGDLDDLEEELGDLLFQVVLHAQIASEAGRFGFAEVVDSLAAKLVRRHPHVFAPAADGPTDAAEVNAAWEAAKAEERRRKAREGRGATSALDGVATALPALSRAQRLQGRAARVGFDWRHPDGAREKLGEELAELDAELAGGRDGGSAGGGGERVAQELGDVLFTCVNLARHHGIDAEGALRAANRRFERRFRSMEAQARDDGGELEACSADQLEALWARAKASDAAGG